MDRSNRPGRGFTLIELLVVIAIIALLLAVLIPGLRIAKELATGAVCLSNQRGLITGWLLYADDNDSRYGENEGGWHLPFNSGANRIANPDTWTFYDPLASYHNKSSTFSFADGHADKHKWTDERTLQFIVDNAEAPGSHSGIRRISSGNQDIEWLLRHFIGGNRVP